VSELHIDLPPDVRRALDAVPRTLGVTPEQAAQVAVKEFLRSRGLLPDALLDAEPVSWTHEGPAPKGRFRGVPEMAFVRGPGL